MVRNGQGGIFATNYKPLAIRSYPQRDTLHDRHATALADFNVRGAAKDVRLLSLQKGRVGWPLRCREDHAGQEACAGRGFCFMHNPLEMFLDGVFAQIHSAGDLLVGEAEHEVNDDHLFAFGQVIELPDVGVRAFELVLIQLFHDDKASAVSREGFIGNTEPAKEEPLIGGKTKPFQLEGLEVLGMIAVHQSTNEVADYGMDLFGDETGAVLSGR